MNKTLTPGGSLLRLLTWRTEEEPDHPFLHVEDDGPWSFGELADEAARLAARLEGAGVGVGHHVVVRIGNDERFLPAVAAVWARGAVAVAMHPATPLAEAQRVVESMDVVSVVFDGVDVDARASDLPRPIALDRFDPQPRRPLTLPVPEIGDDDPALVLLTSGSTGAPKGVVLSHRNGWSNLRATVTAFRRDDLPTPLAPLTKPPNIIANPLTHTAGVVRLLFALYVGRRVVLLRKFNALTAKRAIDRHRVDNLTINPAMLRMLLDLPDGADLGSVSYVSSGTAPLPATLREAFEARFGVPVLQAYGQTESFGGVTIENVRDVRLGRRRPGSVGRALPGVEVRIVTDGGQDVPAGTDGEIVVRTRSATTGYLGVAAATPVDADGWLHTGDLGHLDDDGYLYVTGRLKNIIICGGFNIVPEEVEAALVADTAVRDAVVLGMADERLGEVPVAIVEAEDLPEPIMARVSERLAAYKRPRRIVVVDELPRVPNGKVDKVAAQRLLEVADLGS